MHLQAFLLGVALVSTAHADVSHLANQQQSNAINSAAHTFVAASGQIVKQSYNPNGGASYSSKVYNAGNNNQDNNRYWWMNSGASPFTKNQNTLNNHADTGTQINTHRSNTNGCTSTSCTATAGTLNIKHDKQHVKQNDYSHNPFINAKNTPQSSTNNLFKQMAQISGSPLEVNSLSSTNQQNSYYSQQAPRIPCHGPTQICAPKRVCSNGLIHESDLGLVLSQSKVSQRNYLLFFF